MNGAALTTAAVVAAFLVPLVSLIKRPNWSPQASHLLGLASAFVAAMVGAFVDGNVNSLAELVPYIGTAFVTAQSLYTLYFSGTDINAKLTAK